MNETMAEDPAGVLEALPIPALSDNYVWVIRRPGVPDVAIVDPPDAAPVIAWLEAHGCRLALILN
ncbi:MAG: hypothetical protein D6757_03275, partial [Alphaproteobacteria bacterium]